MTPPDPADRRPRLAVVAVLVIAGLASIATTAVQPAVRAQVTGELPIDGGTTQTRELRIHLDQTSGTGPTGGTLQVGLRSVADLETAYSPWIAISVAPIDGPPVSPATTPAGASVYQPLPFEACQAGCDLTYQLIFTAADELGPGAIIRYRADASFQYQYSGSVGVLSVTLNEGTVAGPPTTALILIMAAIVALVIGLFIGPRWRRDDRRRLVPVGIVLTLLLVVAIWSPLLYLVYLLAPDLILGSNVSLPLDQDLNVALFSSLLLGSLAGGLVVGVRRWTADGGWSLGLAAVATVALGGVWLAWMVSVFAAIRPIAVAIALSGLGVVVGTIVGQTWFRPSPGVVGRRLTPSVAVISQGMICSGFAYLAVNALDPAGTSLGAQQSLLAVPLALAVAVVLIGLWRWFRGSRWLMALVNLLLAIVGVLGLFLWQSLTNTTGTSTNDTLLANLAIGLEVAATIVGFLVSWRRYRPGGRLDPDGGASTEAGAESWVEQAATANAERGAARNWRRP